MQNILVLRKETINDVEVGVVSYKCKTIRR